MISYNYSTKVITVDSTATVRSVYSDAMSVFSQAAQMDDLIPLRADTPTLYTLINGWTFSAGSIQYLTSAALQDAAGNNVWTNVQTLGSLATGTTLYIEQNGAVTWTASAPGHINILLKTKNAGTEINGQNFTVYARKFQNTYDKFSTTGGAVVANVPLATAADIALDISQETIDAYTGLSITWGAASKDAGDGAGAQPYTTVIDGGGKTLKEVYNWVQSELLKNSDIDDGAGTKLGNITAELISMAGSTVITKTGVWVENFAAADANNIRYVDANGVTHTPPQSIAVTISADSGMNGGRAWVARLSAPYNAATYTPADIVAVLLDSAISSGQAQTTLTYSADWPIVIRTRKPGYKPFEVGSTLTSAGVSVQSINEQDTVYQP